MPNWLSKSDKITFSGKPKETREQYAIKQLKTTMKSIPDEILETFKQWYRQRNPLTRPTFFEQQIHSMILKELKNRRIVS